MTRCRLTIAAAAVATLAFAAPSRAIGIRAGAQVPLYTSVSGGGSYSVSDAFVPQAAVMLSWDLLPILSLDLEGATDLSGPAGFTRNYYLRPGVTVSLPILPIYGRGALPISFNNSTAGGASAVQMGTLLAAGLGFGILGVGIYLEGIVELAPLFGGPTGGTSFSTTRLSAAGGIKLHL